MYKNNNKRFFRPGTMTEKEQRDAGMPSKTVDTADSVTLQTKAFRDLAWNSSITPKSDPYTEASKGTDPYSIFNRTNSIIDADYPGEVNLAGNVVNQMVHNPNSSLLDEFDVGVLQLTMNYLYMATRPGMPNSPANREIRMAIEEALSHAQSEQFTELPFFKDYYLTSMPEMDSIVHPNCVGTYYGVSDTILTPSEDQVQGDWFWYVPDASTAPVIYYYDETEEDFIEDTDDRSGFSQSYGGILVWYQTFLQNIAAVPARYNVLRAMEETLCDMGYDREYPLINELFGLLKKAAFVAKVKSAYNILPYNYFDVDWYNQANTLTVVPSRKTNSIRDPLLTVASSTEMPRVIQYTVSGGVYTQLFDSDSMVSTVYPSGESDPIFGDAGGKEFTLETLISRYALLTSPAYILKWARQSLEGVGPLKDIAPVGYFNVINHYLEAITRIGARLTKVSADLKVVLEVMGRVGLNSWVKGKTFEVGNNATYKVCYNKLVQDVITENYCGSDKMVWDGRTYRWHTGAIWNEFLGYPEYLKKQGGAFISSSIKTIVKDPGVPLTDSRYILPIMFNIDLDKAFSLTNRKGDTVLVTRTVADALTAASSVELGRLYPLASMANDSIFDIRVPEMDLTNLATANTSVASAATRVLMRLFGIGAVTYSGTTYTVVNPDIISLIDLEFCDVTNSMLSYAKSRAPFKVQTLSSNRVMGFKAN